MAILDSWCKINKKVRRVPEVFHLVCFSHLRWNFVYQRPQHLLARAAELVPVIFFEEPLFDCIDEPRLQVVLRDGIQVVTPLLPHGSDGQLATRQQKVLLDRYLEDQHVIDFVTWYYTPMAMLFTSHLKPAVTIYDCMDQLSAFRGAPPEMVGQELALFERADVVFTGGRSLYEAKRHQHSNAHVFPSSVDCVHFASGHDCEEPLDQAKIAHPRIGFFGVLDERLDRDLIRDSAASHPEWQFLLIGPVVKIEQDELPRAANIHYLGKKEYSELPAYLARWDVAMLPFALNESTRYISPTKTPEYLAAGKPVVSTPIRDVVEPYGRLGLARIAATTEEFCRAVADLLKAQDEAWIDGVHAFLSQTSWDKTFHAMWSEVLRLKKERSAEDADGMLASA